MEFSLCPKARTEDLVVVDMRDETLVYDLAANKAHCLNKTAAFVWARCDGDQSLKEIARAMEGEFRQAIDVDMVRLAVKQLDDNKLLKKGGFDAGMLPGRRELIKKIGLASAVALPIVASLAAPRSALAVGSCACVAPGDCLTQTGCPSTTNCNGSGVCAP
jgi:coenzyme PQQ synthesis protein D (PqqD)